MPKQKSKPKRRNRKKSYYTRITSSPDHSADPFIPDLNKHFKNTLEIDSNHDLYKPKINGLGKLLKWIDCHIAVTA